MFMSYFPLKGWHDQAPWQIEFVSIYMFYSSRKYYLYINNNDNNFIDPFLSQLIEPVDSLHPTQAAQSLITQHIWSHLETNLPHVLGPVNPYNDVIVNMFGDQGGH